MSAAYASPAYSSENVRNLREVETVFDVEKLNEAQKQGAICLLKHKEFNPKLNLSALLLRNRETGEYVVAPAREVHQQYALPPIIYHEHEWELVQTIEGYARPTRNESNWGAYIVPSDAKIGERFYIRELIEDLVASGFWYSVRPAESAEAVWNGDELIIDPSSYEYILVG